MEKDMNEEVVKKICLKEFNVLPSLIQRNYVGIGAYVYTIQLDSKKYVLKISEASELINGSTFWLKKLQSFELPIPEIVFVNIKTNPPYFIMTYLPGQDLGLVYKTLSSDQKRTIAHAIFQCQNKLKKLPAAKGYGFLHSYDDLDNMNHSWQEVIEKHIERSEQRIKENAIFSMDYIDRVRNYIPYFKDYFDSINPEPFFDDTTTKNVLIDHGEMSGIIDLDWICFGDRLYAIALTTMALLNMHADLEYVECWKDLEKLNKIQEKVLLFYILVFCIDFMSEKGMKFNKEEIAQVHKEEIILLEDLFELYDNKLNYL